MNAVAPSLSPDDYAQMRKKWLPDSPTLIIVAESPPVSSKYFYNENGRPTEPLFSALMESVVSIPLPATKKKGLEAFKAKGYVLLDATYVQIDKMTKAQRKGHILEGIEALCSRLDKIDPNRHTPILLVKVNVCELLEEPLKGRRYKVLNDGVRVDFPANGNQPKFHAKVAAILKAAGI